MTHYTAAPDASPSHIYGMRRLRSRFEESGEYARFAGKTGCLTADSTWQAAIQGPIMGATVPAAPAGAFFWHEGEAVRRPHPIAYGGRLWRLSARKDEGWCHQAGTGSHETAAAALLHRPLEADGRRGWLLVATSATRITVASNNSNEHGRVPPYAPAYPCAQTCMEIKAAVSAAKNGFGAQCASLGETHDSRHACSTALAGAFYSVSGRSDDRARYHHRQRRAAVDPRGSGL